MVVCSAHKILNWFMLNTSTHVNVDKTVSKIMHSRLCTGPDPSCSLSLLIFKLVRSSSWSLKIADFLSCHDGCSNADVSIMLQHLAPIFCDHTGSILHNSRHIHLMHAPWHAHVGSHVHLVADWNHARLHGRVAHAHHIGLHTCSTTNPLFNKCCISFSMSVPTSGQQA